MGLFNDIIKSSKADAGDLSKAAQHCFADLGMHVDVSALSTEENKQARQRINDKAENATGVCATLGGVAGSIIGGAAGLWEGIKCGDLSSAAMGTLYGASKGYDAGKIIGNDPTELIK
mgnify:CR=1 FL=1